MIEPPDVMLFNDSMKDTAFEALAAQVAGRPRAMLALARQVGGQRAAELVGDALAAAPGDTDIAAAGRAILSALAPVWHFTIVHDQIRNDAYEAALRAAVRPGCTVLEIGAGSGLLAMMAARAGAGKVVSCEANPAIAAAARDIVAANGLADRVTILAKHSSELDLEADLGGRADVLVSEIVSNDLLGQGALPVMEQVVPTLLHPDARVIPARGEIRVALACDRQWDQLRMGQVSGFDLSAFDRFSPPVVEISAASPRLDLRSDPAVLFAFDFASGGPFPAGPADVSLTSQGGHVNGVVQWIALALDDRTTYENRPARAQPSCWAVMFHRFLSPLDTACGDVIQVNASHDRAGLTLWRPLGKTCG